MWSKRSSAAIKNDIAIYAIHTNLDNVIHGVNGKIADKLLESEQQEGIAAKEGQLKKLFCFAPVEMADKVREAIFAAGGGDLGKYSECSFNSTGYRYIQSRGGSRSF
jgi:putative NIF3 family GTP cyclohydrolase 1 type 2